MLQGMEAQETGKLVRLVKIALGANLGPLGETFDRVCRLLERQGIAIESRSRLYWTRPWGVTDQPPFLNAALAVATRLSPLALLWICQQIERRLGRRPGQRWGPRRIDLDLILYGRCRVNDDRLRLPHPRIAERDFVLAPLIDLGVAPDPAVAPGGWVRLLGDLPPSQRTILHSEPWR